MKVAKGYARNLLIPQLLALPKLGKYVDLVQRQLEVTLSNVACLPLKVPIEFRERQVMNSLISSALHIMIVYYYIHCKCSFESHSSYYISVNMRGVIETKCGG